MTAAIDVGDSQESGLLVVDPVTGNRSILSDSTHGTGPDFSGALGVTFEPNGMLLVGDNYANELFEVDPTDR